MNKGLQNKKKKPVFSHDRFFKLFYSKPELVRELFQFIFSKKEAQAYDLNKLKIEKDTFEGQSADLVFSVPLKALPKMRMEIFILLEHKSSHDENLFGQILKYQILLREHSIQQKGYSQPVIPVVFYHGKEPLKWKKSLQEEDFKSFFSKIPIESRKSMLNYKPKIINTKDPKIQRAYRARRFKGYSPIKLLSEVWDLKKHINSLKVRDVYVEFEEILQGLKGQARKTVELRILEYLFDNTQLDLKIWKQAEKLLIEEGILKQGGLMQDVREIIREKGRWEGRREGRQEGRQEGRREERQQVVLNMLKEKVDISIIAKVTGLSQKAIQKLKNGS